MALKPIGIDDDDTFPGRVGTALSNLARAAVAEDLASKQPLISIGDTAPVDPQVNDLWVDTSGL